MRRVGGIDKVKAIEKMLLGYKGTQIRTTSGNRGDYKKMGYDRPSGVKTVSLSIPVHLVATLEYDERTNEGAIRIKDDNLGRILTRVPTLMEALSELKEEPNNT